MRTFDILCPLFALTAWTFLVLLLVPFVRVQSVRRREIRPIDFKYGESQAIPPSVSIPNRNYMNLLEIPLLHVLHRLSAFTLSNAALVSLWVIAGVHVASNTV